MYGCEYKFDILLCLRLLKFLYMQAPETAKQVVEMYGAVDVDEICVVIEEIMWDIFSDVTFDSDEFDELTTVYFSHPDIDRLYMLGRQESDKHGSLTNAWRKKIQDIAEFYACGSTHSVLKVSCHFSAMGVIFEMKLSPDCYEPICFGNSLVDMVLCCQRDLRRLEEKMKKIEHVREEAA